MVKKLLPFIFIVFVWLIFARPFFLENKIPFPSSLLVSSYTFWSSYQTFWGPVKNPSQPDVIDQIVPWKKLTIDSLRNGEIPLWNPYSFSGTPHLANYQSSVFSPTNLFFFIFDFKTSWGFAVLVQPLLAGIFMYAFIRSLKLSIWAGIISSFSFMFSGFITVWMGYTTLSLAISFLPLSLFAIEKFFGQKRFIYLLALTVSITLSFLSGHFQTSLYLLIFVFSYILFMFWETRNKKAFLQTIIFTIFGIFISFPQILPSFELYKEAIRSTIFQKVEPVAIRYLPTILAPDLYGNPVTRNHFFGNYIEWNMYLGTIPVLLGLYSLSLKTKKVLFFAGMGLLSLIFALNTPILDLLVSFKIPVLSTSSAGRVLVLFSFSFAVLSGFGIDKLIEDIKQNKKRGIFKFFLFFGIIFGSLWFYILSKEVGEDWNISLKNFIFSTALFGFLLLGTITSIINKNLLKIFLLLLVFIVAFEMLRFSSKWQTFDREEFIFPKTPIISKLEALKNTNRFYGPFGAEASVYYGLPSIEGYDPLYIGRYGQFLESLVDGKIKTSPRSGVKFPAGGKFSPKIFDFLGVRYILQKKLDKGKVWEFPFENYPSDKFTLIYREKDFFIYANKDVFPRAFLVGNYEVISDDQKIIDRIFNENFDLSKNVVLEKDPLLKPADNSIGSAKIINYTSNKIIIETESDHDAILVLSDNYYPGWRAKVNGEEKEIYRANYTFRGVAVPQGKSLIEIYYMPESFKLGVIISLFSIVSIGIITAKWYTKGIKIRKKGRK